MSVSGTLITRAYTDFKGVDFRNRAVALNRSPDALNMWKDYKTNNGISTRPDIALLEEYSNTVYGLYFYDIGNVRHKIVHCGTELYDGDKVIYTGMNPRKSNFFIYNQILYIQDGIQYLEYDGETCQNVVGYIPTTTISRNPAGGGTMYEDVNLLTGIRKNSFSADGTSKDYYLDAQNIDTDFSLVVLVNDQLTTDYMVDTTRGMVSFTTAPEKPLTDGADNVVITFRRTIPDYRKRIDQCTLLTVFDNRVFFSGNKDYPNTVFHCSLNNPRYISDTDYYNEGMDLSPVRSMVAGNNALWVFKEPSQANTTVFYHNPVIDNELGKVYPSTHSSIATGCVGSAVNFNDDIVFFSDRGMEGISGDITTEQIIAHRSTFVDNKLLNEANYKDMILEEYEGYLLVIIGNKVYLADSRQKVQIEEHLEYEWYYWELSKEVTCTLVKDGVLYLCTKDGIYTLTKTATEIESYWTTPEDSFEYPHYQKTTNKKGFVMEVTGSAIKLQARTDNGMFMTVDTYLNRKGYLVARLKKKKWRTIQLKFTSTTPFGLYLVTLESYVGGYTKN
jgi:hypothetical protein